MLNVEPPANIKNSISTDRTIKPVRVGIKRKYNFDIDLPEIPAEKRPKMMIGGGMASVNNSANSKYQ